MTAGKGNAAERMRHSGGLSPEALAEAERTIEELIRERGAEAGLSTDDTWPITDGVVDTDAYLASSPRIMWILKEPYDDRDEEGRPCGGGWSHSEMLRSKKEWTVLTWQRVIRSMYGYIHGTLCADQPDLKEHPEMGEALRGVAWINVSKMPALKSSRMPALRRGYGIWRDIVLRQVSEYDPDIIVFGNTLRLTGEDFLTREELESPAERIMYEGWNMANIFLKDGRILVDAYHPGIRCKDERYVDSMVGILRRYARQEQLPKKDIT